MSDIGLNKGTFFSNDINLGKQLKSFSSKESAEEYAKSISGSEIIYKKDEKWIVNEVKEGGVISDSPLSSNDKNNIVIDTAKLGSSLYEISFAENDLSKEDALNLAKSKNVSPEILDNMTEMFYSGILDYATNSDLAKEIAKNPNSNDEILKKVSSRALSPMHGKEIREIVSNHPNVSIDTLFLLTNRFDGFDNHAPLEKLLKLASDTGTDKEILKQILDNCAKQGVLPSDSQNNNLIRDIKNTLINSHNAITKNPPLATFSMREILYNIAAEAEKNLNKK